MSFARIIIEPVNRPLLYKLFYCKCGSRQCPGCVLANWLDRKRALISSDIHLTDHEWFEPTAFSNGVIWSHSTTGKEIFAGVSSKLHIVVTYRAPGQEAIRGRADAMIEHWKWMHS